MRHREGANFPVSYIVLFSCFSIGCTGAYVERRKRQKIERKFIDNDVKMKQVQGSLCGGQGQSKVYFIIRGEHTMIEHTLNQSHIVSYGNYLKKADRSDGTVEKYLRDVQSFLPG